jgi:hypothetical protein
MVETLTLGPIHTLAQNVVYALPARAALIFSNVALQISNNTAFTVSQAVAASTPTEAVGGFVRSTTGAALVTVKGR